MFSNRNLKFLTYFFGCVHIFLVLVVLSQGAVPIVTDWLAAVIIVTPCALNIILALFWMIGAGLKRPPMIDTFRYFTYGQMAVIAGLTIWYCLHSIFHGGHFHLYLVIFLLLSLFILSMMEVFVAIGTVRAVQQELMGARMRAVEMTEWTETS
ncbi:uncharacterized protein LOC129755512 isoform X3 [Uranotaenia lowii]|uniref:uncharacterized protein LOC129755512 isoform X3 n=1 Tax=Uranotaenia lowii TaxID=190385 RepID=UPI0024783FBA|nr:uncharacterized protein LOC129755512 isoform X3 [Uranotaenia lowii]